MRRAFAGSCHSPHIPGKPHASLEVLRALPFSVRMNLMSLVVLAACRLSALVARPAVTGAPCPMWSPQLPRTTCTLQLLLTLLPVLPLCVISQPSALWVSSLALLKPGCVAAGWRARGSSGRALVTTAAAGPYYGPKGMTVREHWTAWVGCTSAADVCRVGQGVWGGRRPGAPF